MKNFILLSSLFFLFYTFNIYQSYTSKINNKTTNTSYQSNQVTKCTLNLDKKEYIFKDSAWSIKRKKVITVKTDDINDSILNPLRIDISSSPILICETKKKCFEFIALENNKAIFYGIKEGNTSSFIILDINESIDKRIILQKITPQAIELLDTDLNQTHVIKMFDINITKYKAKDKKDEN